MIHFVKSHHADMTFLLAYKKNEVVSMHKKIRSIRSNNICTNDITLILDGEGV